MFYGLMCKMPLTASAYTPHHVKFFDGIIVWSVIITTFSYGVYFVLTSTVIICSLNLKYKWDGKVNCQNFK